jgi:hypothetical protein
LPAIAPGGAAADGTCFEQDNPIATLGEVQRRRTAGEATTNDRDIGPLSARKRRRVGGSCACCANIISQYK